tara:strand:+ start:2341 stop:2544 length:204 start_codon:yes stop_codon:yes gene_type:complete
LELASLVLQIYRANLKVDANGGKKTIREGVICESDHEARLPDSRVSNQEQLEQVVAASTNAPQIENE